MPFNLTTTAFEYGKRIPEAKDYLDIGTYILPIITKLENSLT
jgi:hypothetical protein